MNRRFWYWSVVLCALAASVACGNHPSSPVAPTAVTSTTANANADGSTLKVTAPTPKSPINTTGITPGQRVTLVVNNSTVLYASGIALSYRFEISNSAGNIVESALVPSGGPDTTSRTVGVDLDGNQNYQWRARAEYQSVAGPWSDRISFVAPPPRLTVTSFLAFGDSITEGTLDPPCTSSSLSVGLSPFGLERRALMRADALSLTPSAVNVSTSYPARLESLLMSRFTSQSPTVINEGLSGEYVVDHASIIRLRAALSRTPPQVLLLQEGINDINTSLSEMVPAIEALRAMVREAQGRGIQVMVGTLLPERARACRGVAVGLIPQTNDGIRAMAAAEGATLVDLYQAFLGQESSLLGFDGLHPTIAGYQQMAQTFLDAIRLKYETPTPTSLR